jgi:hypothetical protein
VSEAPTPSAARRGWLTPRRLAVVLGVWAVAAGGALLLANALDSPVGEGARDEAQAVAPGPVAVPGGAAAGAGSLPPLALVLAEPLPEDIAGLPPIERASRLTERAQADPDPRRLVELGSALQLLGNGEGAAIAYREAIRRDPDEVAARAGLVMTEGSGGGAAGLARAAAGLARLARDHPDDQVVAFNQGWVEVYRSRAGPAAEAWRRTVALGAETRLGLTAAGLLDRLERGGG